MSKNVKKCLLEGLITYAYAALYMYGAILFVFCVDIHKAISIGLAMLLSGSIAGVNIAATKLLDKIFGKDDPVE